MQKLFNKNISKLRFGVLLSLLCVFAVLSCRVEQIKNDDSANQPTKKETSANRIVIDDLGKKIELPNEVTRAVSLAPNLTEIIFAVSAGDRLVGVTSFCNYPQEATKIQKVGDTLKPNIENIIALKPQVVFVSTDSQLESFTSTLEKQGIKVFVSNPKSLDEIHLSIRKVGEVFFGQSEAVESVIDRMYHREKEIELKLENAEKVGTFVQIDKSPFTIGKESFLTDLIEKAGGVSVTKDVDKNYFNISKETASALNPDAIILSDSPDNNEPNEVFANSNAVKNGRVFKINADILSRPSPRIVDALEQIAKSLHPEKFD